MLRRKARRRQKTRGVDSKHLGVFDAQVTWLVMSLVTGGWM